MEIQFCRTWSSCGVVDETWNLEKTCAFKSRKKQRERLKNYQFDITQRERKGLIRLLEK